MKLMTCMFIMFTMASFSQSKGWCGIVPLHSTRADVERLLGSVKNPASNTYDLGNEVAVILYAKTPCKKAGVGGWNVPSGTVVEIRVSPKTELRLADLDINLERYKRVEDPLVKSHTSYINEEEGVIYHVFEGGGEANGKILNITYTPTVKDNPLRCPDAAIKNPYKSEHKD